MTRRSPAEIISLESSDNEETMEMTELENTDFDAAAFLGKEGLGRRTVRLKPKEAFFSQGDPADSVFYLQKGRARITVTSDRGKKATITLLSAGEFIGEESIAGSAGFRLATATAMTTSYSTEDRKGRNDPRDA